MTAEVKISAVIVGALVLVLLPTTGLRKCNRSAITGATLVTISHGPPMGARKGWDSRKACSEDQRDREAPPDGHLQVPDEVHAECKRAYVDSEAYDFDA